ncbi:unnamed protein product [Trichobilharzia szidati]|nr:unnamed protein product [Trichobilharzia szidati]
MPPSLFKTCITRNNKALSYDEKGCTEIRESSTALRIQQGVGSKYSLCSHELVGVLLDIGHLKALFCYVTACKPDEKKHSAMIAGLKKNGFLKTAAAERSMQGVDRSCFVDDEPYENRSQIVEVGRHPPVKVMFPAPYVHALILDALSAGIGERSHALVVELGIGYMTACTALMTGRQGVTVSAQPNSDLFSWVSSHIKSWLDNSRAYTHGLSLGNQIKLTTYDNKIPELLTAKYDAIFVRAVRESDVSRWLPRLKTGGIMVCLVGYNGGKQELYQLRRLSETSVQKKTLMNFQDFKPTVAPSKEESVVQPIPPE